MADSFRRAFIDPALAAAVAALGPRPDMGPDTLAESRLASAVSTASVADLVADGRHTCTELRIPREGDASIRALLFRPTGFVGRLPVVYSIHGGGLVSGVVTQGPDSLLPWTSELPFAVCSIEYRLAPEHPHPVPVEDCHAGLQWLHDHADELGIDATRIVIMGESAGGGLAAATALLARARGGPALAGMLLVFPMLDDRNDAPSVQQLATDATWTRASNRFGWNALLGDAVAGPDVPETAAPARATTLVGLPRMYLETGSAELLRSEILAFAEQAWLDGLDCELHVWPGGLHSYVDFAPRLRISVETLRARKAWLLDALG